MLVQRRPVIGLVTVEVLGIDLVAPMAGLAGLTTTINPRTHTAARETAMDRKFNRVVRAVTTICCGAIGYPP
jgi:hypothetical protein